MANECAYCGTGTSEAQDRCTQCGNELQTNTEDSGQPPTMATPPLLEPAGTAKIYLKASSATLIFMGYFVSQMAVGLIVAMISFGANPDLGVKASSERTRAMQEMMAMAVVPTMLVSGIVVWFLAHRLVGPQLGDRSPTGAAWATGTLSQNLRGALAGFMTAVGYALLSTLSPPEENLKMGPLAEMALQPGFKQVMWIAAALLLAPFVEEFLFRGVLYGGYCRSFGPIWAAVLSALIFWALHLTETARYWPAMVAIGGLAFVTLWHRLKFAAIGPAISAHLGYNGVMVLGSIAATFSKPN